LILVVAPALYLGARLALFRRRWARRLGMTGLLGLIIWSAPAQGFDFVVLKRLDFLLAGALALLMLMRHWRIGWVLDRQRYRAWLGALAALALVVYLNFFSFHGARTFVHLHDLANYYLGSKYYAELGYTDLYTAMLRAEAEVYDNHFKALVARDLRTYDQVDIRMLLRESGPVKAEFTPQRWVEFKLDVAYFREALGDQYGAVLLDHGFNPTPVWVLFGGSLSRLVPAGSGRGILLLTLVDPLLLAGMLTAVFWAFGIEATWLVIAHFCLIFGATFGWTGGSLLRYLWLFSLVVAVCCLRRQRYLAAGALLALSSLLRVFPLLFVLPIGLKALAAGRRRRTAPRRYRHFFAALLVTAALLFALTRTLPRGWNHWAEFQNKLSVHAETISPNIVGLTQILAFRPDDGLVTNEEFRDLKLRRRNIYYAQLVLVFTAALLLVGLMSRWQSGLGAATLALPLLFVGLNLASYYYVFLILLVLFWRQRPRQLAWIFGLEAGSYALLLFEDREALLYIYRSILVLYLLLALHLEPAKAELLGIAARLRSSKQTPGHEPAAG
jgi:hypothetical protein